MKYKDWNPLDIKTSQPYRFADLELQIEQRVSAGETPEQIYDSISKMLNTTGHDRVLQYTIWFLNKHCRGVKD